MRTAGSAVLPYFIQSNNLVQESGELFRRAARKNLMPASGAAADHVVWSVQSRDMQRWHQLIRDTPDMREVRIVEAQVALTTQTLPLEGRTLAPKLIAEALSMAAGHPA
jgi:hypothetical protein